MVVDSIERVPEEFRKTMMVETIGKMHAPDNPGETTTSGHLDSGLQENSTGESSLGSVASQNVGTGENDAAKTASETEIPDYEHASASLWLAEMQAMLRRNDEIWHVATAFSPYHRRILVLQEENLRMIDRLRELETMTWQDHQDWIDRARGVNDQLRQLAFSISMWLRQSPDQIRLNLPPLVNRVRTVLDMTTQALPPARKGNE